MLGWECACSHIIKSSEDSLVIATVPIVLPLAPAQPKRCPKLLETLSGLKDGIQNELVPSLMLRSDTEKPSLKYSKVSEKGTWWWWKGKMYYPPYITGGPDSPIHDKVTHVIEYAVKAEKPCQKKGHVHPAADDSDHLIRVIEITYLLDDAGQIMPDYFVFSYDEIDHRQDLPPGHVAAIPCPAFSFTFLGSKRDMWDNSLGIHIKKGRLKKNHYRRAVAAFSALLPFQAIVRLPSR
jgi:hypothetical protein